MAYIVRHFARCYSKRNSSMNTKKPPASSYIEAMYNAWLNNPGSVHKSWDTYFRNCPVSEEDILESESTQILHSKKTRSLPMDAIGAHATVHALIRKYQEKGYSIARLCPLETNQSNYPAKELHKEFNLMPQDWEHEFRLPPTTLIGGKDQNTLILKEIIKRLELVYCNKVGIDYMFLDSYEQRYWIREKFEIPKLMEHQPSERLKMLGRLARAVVFDKFIANHFPAHQNVSLAGCEILVPALKQLIDVSSSMGVRSFVMGLPQRGRLSILATVCKKSLKEILSLFNSNDCDDGDDLGDLKYSLGTVIERWNWTTNKEVRLSVVPNPGHFEAFVPVVLGKTRAEQVLRGDSDTGSEVMSIIVHDDHALHGQGIAYEAVVLSTMPSYNTHGTIHIVMNTLDNLNDPLSNQSANNTLNPFSMQYCKNISRALDAPLFHVNANDPDAVMYVCKVAGEWRNLFHRDVIIDLVGYRDSDDDKCEMTMFSEPTLNANVAMHPSCLDTYTDKLIADQVTTANEAKENIENFVEVCQTALDLAELVPIDEMQWYDTTNWTKQLNLSNDITTSGVKTETLIEVGNRFLSPPRNDPNFVLRKSIHKILLERKAMLDKHTADWTLAEALAFATLLKDRIHVRLSIQASEQEAFAKRHHIYHHQLIPGKNYSPLEHLYAKQASYVIVHTSSSESAVLGFEHGYSMANPNMLVLWDAQCGDFASATQSIIDHFIASGQSKWGMPSGLVMLLPYGIGHDDMNVQSSARLERFLQMNSDDPASFIQDPEIDMQNRLRDVNFIVANCTTPANYFHILRRQLALPFRKPLILMVSKSLTEHGEIKSSLKEMNEQSEFQALIPEEIPQDRNAMNFRRLIFCSGRIYYDLVRARADRNLKDKIAIARIEQLAPFPYESVTSLIGLFEQADLVWVQEEHQNQGAWSFVQPRFDATIFDNRDISYIGRGYSGLVANTSKTERMQEQQALLDEALLSPTAFSEKYW